MEVQAASADSIPLPFVDREELFVAKRSRRLKKATLLKGRDMRSVPHMLLVDFMTISLVPEAEDSNQELDFSDTEPVDWVTYSQSAKGWTTHRPDESSEDTSGAARNISSEDRLGSVDAEGTSSQSLGSAGLHSSLLDGPSSQYKPTSPGHGDSVEDEVKDNENSSDGQWRSADHRLDAMQVGGQNVEVDTWTGAQRTQDSPSVQQRLQSPEGEYPDATSPSCSLSANVVHSSSARDSSHTDSVLECNLHKQASVDRGESFEVAEENIIRQSPFLQFSRSGNTFTGFPLLMTDSAEHVSEEDVSGTTPSQVRLVEDKSGVMNCEIVNEDSALSPEQSEPNVSSSQAEDTFSTNTFESTSIADASGYPVDSGMECGSTDDEQIPKSDDVLSHSGDVVEVMKTDISSSSVSNKKFTAPSVERGESFEATISKPLIRQDHFGFGLHFGMLQATWSSLDPENERSTFTQKDVIEETKDETTEPTMRYDELHSTSTSLVTASEKGSFKTESGDLEDVTRQNGDSDDGSIDDTKLGTQYSAEGEDPSMLCDSAQKSYVHDQVQGSDKAHEKSDSFEYVHGDALVQHASFTPRSQHITEAQQAPEDVLEVSHSSPVATATTSVSTEQVREVSHIIMDNPVITNPERGVTDNKDRVIEEIQLSGSFIETGETDVDPQIVTEQTDTVKSSSQRLPSMQSIERGESFEAASPSKLQRSIHSGFSQGSSEFLVSVYSGLKEVDETPESHDLRDTSMQDDDHLHDTGDNLIQCEDQSDVSEKSASVSNAAAMDSEWIGEQSTQEETVLMQMSADATNGITSESRSSQDIPDTDSPIKRARSIERGESFEVYKPKSLPLQKHDFLINGGNFNTSFHTTLLEDEREDGDQSTNKEAGTEGEMTNSSSWMEKVASSGREAYSSLEKRLRRKKRTSKNGVNTESANSLDIEEEDEGSSNEEDDTRNEEQLRSEINLEVRVSTTDVPEDFPSSANSHRYVSFASLSLSDSESMSTEKHPEYSTQVQILEKSNPVSVRKYSEETVQSEYIKPDDKLYMENKMPDVQRVDLFPADSVTNENVDNSEKTPVFLESRSADNTAEPSLSGAPQNRNEQSSSEHRRAMFKTYGQTCQMGESVSDQSSVFTSVTSMNSNVFSSSVVSDSVEGLEEREFSPESPLCVPNQTDTLPVMPDTAGEKHETLNSAGTFSPPKHYQTEYERNLSTSSSTFSQSVSLDSFQNAFTTQVIDPSVQSLHDELASATRGTSFPSHSSHKDDDVQGSIERIPAKKQSAGQEKGSDSDEEPPEVEVESHINVELEPEQPFVQDFANIENWDPSLTFEDRGPDMNATRWNRAYLTRYNSFGDSGQPTTAESQSCLTRHQSLGESTKYDSAKNRAYLSRYHSVGDSTMSATTNNYQSSFRPTDLAMGMSYTAGQQAEPNMSSDHQSVLNKTDSLSDPEVSQQPASETKLGPSDLDSVEEAFRKKQESYQYGRSNSQSFDTRIEAGKGEETNSDIRQHEEEYPVDSKSNEEKETRIYQDMPAYQQDAAADSLVLEKPMPAQENAFLDSRIDTPYGTLQSAELHLKDFSNAARRGAPDAEESATDHSTDHKIVAETSENLSAPLKSVDEERIEMSHEERLFDTDQLSISKYASDNEPMTSTVHTSLKEESRALFDQPPSQQMPQQKLSPEEEAFQIMQTLTELTQLWDDENAGEGSAVSSTSSFIASDGERPKKMAYTSKVVSFSRQNSVNPSDVFEEEQDPDILEKELEETVVEETAFDSPDHTDLPSSTEIPVRLSAQADVESEIWKQDLEQEMNSVPVPPGERTVEGNSETDSKDSWPSVLARDSLLWKADENSGKVDVRDNDEVTVSEEGFFVKTSSTQKLHAVEIPAKSSDDRLALDKTSTEDISEERHTSLFEDPLKTGQSSSGYDNSTVVHVDRGESFAVMTRKKLPPGLSGGFLTGVPLPTTESDADDTQSSSWIKRIVTAAKGAYDSIGQKLKRKPKHGKSKSGDGVEESTSDEDDSDTEHDTDNTHHGDYTNTVTDKVTMITAGEIMPSLDQQRLEFPDAQPGDSVLPEFAEESVTLESSSIMIPPSDFQSHKQVPATSSLHSTVPGDHVQNEEVLWEITGLQIQAQEPDTDDLKSLLFEQTFDRTNVFKESISDDSDVREDNRLSATKPRTSEKEEENQEIEADDTSHQFIPTQVLFNSLVENANGIEQKKTSTDFDANNACYEEENNPCDEDVFTASTDALKDSSSEQLSASSSTSASRSHSVSSDVVANPADTVDGYEKLPSEPEEYFNSDSIIFTNSSVVEEGYDGFVPSTDEKSRLRSRHRSGATERHDSYSTSEADDDNKDRVHKSCTQIKHKPDKSLHLVADSWMDYEADDETCSDRPASVSDSLPVLSNQQSQESDPMTGMEESETPEQFSENQELQYTDINQLVNKDIHVDTSFNLETTAIISSSERTGGVDETEQSSGFEQNHDNELEIHSLAKDIVSDVIAGARKQVQEDTDVEDKQRSPTILENNEPLEAVSQERQQLAENAVLLESSGIPHDNFMSASTETSTRVQTSQAASISKPTVEIQKGLTQVTLPGYYQSLSAESVPSATDMSPLEDYPLTFGSTDIEDLSIFTETDLKQWSDSQTAQSPTEEAVSIELINPFGGDEELKHSQAEQSNNEVERGLEKDDSEQASSKKLKKLHAQPICSSEDSAQDDLEKEHTYINKDINRLSREFSDNSVNLGPHLSRSIDSLTLVNFEAQAAMQMEFAAQNAFSSSVDDLDSPVFPSRGVLPKYQTSSEDASWTNDLSRDGVLSISSFDVVPSSPVSVDGIPAQEPFSESMPNASSIDISQSSQPSADSTSKPTELPTERFSSGSVEETQDKEDIHSMVSPQTTDIVSRQREETDDTVGPCVSRHYLQRSDALTLELDVSPDLALSVQHRTESPGQEISGDQESTLDSGHGVSLEEQSLSVKAVCLETATPQSEEPQVWQQKDFVPDTSDTDPMLKDSQTLTHLSSENTEHIDIPKQDIVSEQTSASKQPPDDGRSSPSWMEKVIVTAKNAYGSLEKRLRRKKKTKATTDADGDEGILDDFSDEEECSDYDEDSVEDKQDENNDVEQMKQISDGGSAYIAAKATGPYESSEDFEQNLNAAGPEKHSLAFELNQETPLGSSQHFDLSDMHSTDATTHDLVQMSSASVVSRHADPDLETTLELSSNLAEQPMETATSLTMTTNLQWADKDRDTQPEDKGESSESSQRFLEASDRLSCTVSQSPESTWDSGHGVSLEEQSLSVKAVCPDTATPQSEEPQVWQQEDTDPMMKDSLLLAPLTSENAEQADTSHGQTPSEPEQSTDADGRSSPSWMEKVVTTVKDTYSSLGKRLRRKKKKKPANDEDGDHSSEDEVSEEEEYTESDEDSTDNIRDEDEDVDQRKQTHTRGPFTDTSEATELSEPELSKDFAHTFHGTDAEKASLAFGLEQETPIHTLRPFVDNNKLSTDYKAENVIQMSSATMVSHQADPDLETSLEFSPNLAEVSEETAPSLAMTANLQWPDKDRGTQPEDRGQSSESSQQFLEASDGLSCTVSQSPESPWDSGHGVSLEEQSLSVKAVCLDTATPQAEEPHVWQQEDIVPDTTDTDPTLKDSQTPTPLSSENVEHVDTLLQDTGPILAPSEPEQPTDADGRSSPSWMEKVVTTAKDTYSSLGKRLRRKKKKKPANDKDGDQGIEDDFSEEEEYTESDQDSAEDRQDEDEDVDQLQRRPDEGSFTSTLDDRGLYEPESSAEFRQTFHDTGTETLPLTFGLEQELPIHSFGHSSDNSARSTDDATDDSIQMSTATLVSRQADPDLEPALELTPNIEQSMETSPSLAMTTNIQWADKDRDTPTEDRGQSSESSQRFMEASDGLSFAVSQSPESLWDSGHGVSLEEQSLSVKAVCPDTATPQSEEPQVWQQEDTHPMMKDSQMLAPLTSESSEQADTSHGQTPSEPEQPINADGRSSPSWMEKAVTTAKDAYSSLGKRLRRKKKKKPASDENGDQGIEDDFSEEEEYTESDEEKADDRQDEDEDVDKIKWRHNEGPFTSTPDDREMYEPESSADLRQTVHGTDTEQRALAFDLEQKMPIHDLGHFDANVTHSIEDTADDIVQMSSATMVSRQSEPDLETTVELSPNLAEVSEETAASLAMTTNLQWTDKERDTPTEDVAQSSESSQQFLGAFNAVYCPDSQSPESPWDSGHGVSLEEQSLSVKAVCPDTATPQAEDVQVWQQEDFVPETSDTDTMLKDSLLLTPVSSENAEHVDTTTQNVVPEQTPSEPEQPTDADGRSSPSWMEKVVTTAKDTYSSLGKRLRRKKKKKPASDEDGHQGIEDDVSDEEEYTESDEDSADGRRDEDADVDQMKQRHDEKPVASASEYTGLYVPESSEDLIQICHAADTGKLPHSAGFGQEPPIHSLQNFDLSDTHSTDATTDDLVQMSSATMVTHHAYPDLETTLELSSNFAEQSMETAPSLTMTTNLQWADKDRDTQPEDKGESSESSQQFLEASGGLSCTVSQSPESPWDSGHGVSLEEQSLSVKAVCSDTATLQAEEPQVWQQDTDPMMKDSQLLASLTSENSEQADTSHGQMSSEPGQPTDAYGQSSPSWMEKVDTTAKDTYSSLEKRLSRKKKKKPASEEEGDQGIEDDFSEEEEYTESDEESAEDRQDEDEDINKIKWRHDEGSFTSTRDDREMNEPEFSADFKQTVHDTDTEQHTLAFDVEKEMPIHSLGHFDANVTCSTEDTADDIVQMSSATMVSRQAEPDLETALELSPNLAEVSEETAPSLAMTTNLQWTESDTPTEDVTLSSESSQQFLGVLNAVYCPDSQSPESPWDSGHGVSLEEQSLSVKAVCPDTATPQAEEAQVWQQEDFVPDTSDTDPMLKDSLLLTPLSSENAEQADTTTQDMVPGQTPSDPEQPTDADGRSSPSWMEKVVTTAKDAYSSLGKRLRRKKKKKPASDEDGDQGIEDDVSDEEEYTESDEDSADDRRDEDADGDQMKQRHDEKPVVSASEATGLYVPESSEDLVQTFHATDTGKLPHSAGLEQEPPIHSLQHFDLSDTHSTNATTDDLVQMSSATMVSRHADPDLETTLELSSNLAEQPLETAPSLTITANLQWENKDRDTQPDDRGQSSESSQRFLEASGGLSCTVSQSPESTWDSGHGVSLEEQSLSVKAVCPDTATSQSEEPQVWQQEDTHPMMKDSQMLASLTSQSSEQADTSHGQTFSEPGQPTDVDGRSSPSWMEKVVTTAKDTYSSLGKRLRRKKKKKPASEEEGDQGIEDDFIEEEYTESDEERAEDRQDEDNDIDKIKWRHDEGPFTSTLDDREMYEPESSADFKQTVHDTDTEQHPLAFNLEQEMPIHSLGHFDANVTCSTEDTAHGIVQMSSATMVSRQAEPDLETALELSPNLAEVSEETAPSLAMTTNLQWTDKKGDTPTEDVAQSSESSQQFLGAFNAVYCPDSQSPESPWDSGHGVSLEEQSLSVKAVCPDTATPQAEEAQVWQQEDFVPDTSDTDPMLKDSLLLTPLSSENAEQADTTTQDMVPGQTPSDPEQPTDDDGRSSPSWMEKVVTTAKDAYSSLGKRLRRKKKKKPASDEDGDQGIEDDVSDEEEYTESDEDSAYDRRDEDADVDQMKQRHDEKPVASASEATGLYVPESSEDLVQTFHAADTGKLPHSAGLEQEPPIHSLQHFDLSDTHSTNATTDDLVQMSSATMVSRHADPDLETTLELSSNLAEQPLETAPSLTMTTNLQWENKDRDTQSKDKGQSSESSQQFLEASGGLSCTVSQSPESPWDSGHGVSLEEQSLSVKAVCPDTATPQSEDVQVWQQEDTDPMMKDSQLLASLTSESSKQADTSHQDMGHGQTPSEPEQPTDADGRSSPSWMEKVVTTTKDTFSSLEKRLRRKKKKPASDENGDQGIEDDFSEEGEYTESDEERAEDGQDEDIDKIKWRHHEGPFTSVQDDRELYEPESSADFKQTVHDTDTEQCTHAFDVEQETPIHDLGHFDANVTRSTEDTADSIVQMSSATLVTRQADPALETTLDLSPNLAEVSQETAPSLAMTTNLQWTESDTPTEDVAQSSESSQQFLGAFNELYCPVSQSPESPWDSGHGVSLEEQSLSVKAVCPDTAAPQAEEVQVWKQEDFVPDTPDTDPMLKDSLLLASPPSEYVEHIDTSTKDVVPEQTPSDPEQPTDADGRSSPSWMEKVVTTAKDTYSSLGKRLRRKKKKKPANYEDGDQGIEEDVSDEKEYTDSDEDSADDRRGEDEDIDQLEERRDEESFTSPLDSRGLYEPESSADFKQTLLDNDTEKLPLPFGLQQETTIHSMGYFHDDGTHSRDDTADDIVQMSSATMVSRQADPDLETSMELTHTTVEQSMETAPSLAMTTNLQRADKDRDTPTEDRGQSSESSQWFLETSDRLSFAVSQSPESRWDSGHGVSLEEQSLSVKAVCPDTATPQAEEVQVWQQKEFVPDTSDTDPTLKDSLLLVSPPSEYVEHADTTTQNVVPEQTPSEPEQPTDADGRSSPSWMEKVVTTAKDTYSSLGKRLRRKKKKKPASDEDGDQGIEDDVSDEEEYSDSDENSAEEGADTLESIDKMRQVRDGDMSTDGLHSEEIEQTLYDSKRKDDSILQVESSSLSLTFKEEQPVGSAQHVDDIERHLTDEVRDKDVEMTSTTMVSRMSEPEREQTENLSPTSAEQSIETAPSVALTTNLQWADKDRDTQSEDKGQSSESSQRFLEASGGLPCTVSQSPESPWDSGHGVSLEEQSLSVKAVCPDTATPQSEAEDASHRVNEGDNVKDDDSSFTEEEAASLSASDEELSSNAKDNAEAENRYRDTYFSALAEKEDSNVASTEHAQKVLTVHELPSSTAEYHDTYVCALAERGRTVSISQEIPDQASSTDRQQDQETAVFSADLQLDQRVVEQAKDTEEDKKEDNRGDDKHDSPQTNNRGSGQDTKEDIKAGLEPDTVQITERNTSSFTTQDYDAAIVAAVLEADRRLSKSFSEDPSFHLSDACSDGQNTDDDREQSVFDQEISETRDQLFSPPLLPSETPRSDQKQTEQTFSQEGEDRESREGFLINTAKSMPVHEVATDMKQMADLQAETDTQVEFDRDSSKLDTQHTDSGDRAAIMQAGQVADTCLQSHYQTKAGESRGEQLARGDSKQATRRASWLKRAVSKAKDAFTSVEERFKRKRKQKIDGNLETRTGQSGDDIVQSSTDESDEEEVDTEALTATKEDNTAVCSQTQSELYKDTISEKAVSRTQHFSCEDDQLVLSGTTEPSMRARGYDSTGNWSRGNNDTASVSLPSQQGTALLHSQSSSEQEQRLLQEERRSTMERTPHYSGTQQGESVEDVMQQRLMSSVASASSEGFQRYLPQHSEATIGAANNQDWNQNTTDGGFCRKETRLPVSRQLALSANSSDTFDERSTLRIQDQATGELSTEANQHFLTGTSDLNVESSRQDMSASLGEGQILCTGEQKSFSSPPSGQEQAEDVVEGNKASVAETIRTSSSETLMRNVMTTVSHTSVSSPTSTRPTESGEGSVCEPRQDNLISEHASSTSEYRQSVLPGTSELAFQRAATTDAMTRSDVGLSFVSTHALSMLPEHQSHDSTEDNQRTVTSDKEILLQVRAAEAEYEGTGGARTFLGRHVARPMPPRQLSADGTCDTLEADDKPLIGNEAAEDENEAAPADQENIDPSNMPLSGLFKTTKGKKSKSKKGKDKNATDNPVTDDVTSKEEAKAEEQTPTAVSPEASDVIVTSLSDDVINTETAELKADEVEGSEEEKEEEEEEKEIIDLSVEQAQATMSDTKTDTMTAGDQNSAAVLYTTEIGDSAQTPGEGPQLSPPEGGVVEMQPAKADGSLPPETAGREKQSLLHDHNPEGMVCCTIL